MRGADGRNLCKQIKAIAPSTIVILFSASKNLLDTCKHCNTDDYIEKPFGINEFKTKIQKYIDEVKE